MNPNKELVRLVIHNIWNAGNVDAVDEYFAPSHVDHATGDRAGYKRNVLGLRSAFPDLQISIDDLIAEGERVALRFTVRGTHRGEFGGVAPTQRPVTFSGVAVCVVRDGRLVERWSYSDMASVLEQIRTAH